MNTFEGFEIREIPLSVGFLRKKWENFLSANGLRPENVDYCAGIFDNDDNLVGTGSLHGDIIKNVALAPSTREGGVSNALISHLLSYGYGKGCDNIMIFTKPEYKRLFESMSFHYVGGADSAVLLESNPRGLQTYLSYLSNLRKEGKNGVIVMNVNPFTKGHLYLIEEASRKVDNLYIIPVSDNPLTQFSYRERCKMLEKGTSHLDNVMVCEGSRYTISNSTFPTYFLKEISTATDQHITLDLDIFCRHIAPALNASVRFVGTEPRDMLTARYNELMKNKLPEAGIEVVEIERAELDDDVISASRVRRYLSEGKLCEALRYIPESTHDEIISHVAADSLYHELDATPKPGLVDRADCGSHRDMDYDLMAKSIDTLQPYFSIFSNLGSNHASAKEIREAGIRAEAEMMRATGGINTHRGALFSLGIVTVAYASLRQRNIDVNEATLGEEVSLIASEFMQPEGTHGSLTEGKYNRGGALKNAQNGYYQLFSSWLPFYRSIKGIEENGRKLLLLLKIMSEIDDSNILYRCGKDIADEVKMKSKQLLDDIDLLKEGDNITKIFRDWNKDFITRNISPGGAADMLSLTLYIDTIIYK